MNPIHSNSSSDLVWKAPLSSLPSPPSSPPSKRIAADTHVVDWKVKVLKVACFPCNYIWRRRVYIIDTFADLAHILMIVLCCSNDERMRHDDFNKKTTEGLFDDSVKE